MQRRAAMEGRVRRGEAWNKMEMWMGDQGLCLVTADHSRNSVWWVWLSDAGSPGWQRLPSSVGLKAAGNFHCVSPLAIAILAKDLWLWCEKCFCAGLGL